VADDVFHLRQLLFLKRWQDELPKSKEKANAFNVFFGQDS
jgi:hypothetical protein